MATQDWHSQLPQLVDQDGFQKSYGETVMRTQNQYGPDKSRRVSTRPRDMYSVTMTISADQEPILDQFFNTSLNGGATYFHFLDPITNVDTEFEMMGAPVLSPIGFQTYKVSMTWKKIGEYLG